MSRIIIVDAEDAIIGHKERGTLNRDDIYRVSALWITNSKGESLLAQRSFSKKHSPGMWGPAVAGTNDEGESYDANIVKEAEEELGISDVPFIRRGKMRHRGEHEYFLQWYSAVIDEPEWHFIIQEDEVERIKWFSPEELKIAIVGHPEDFISGMEMYIERFV
ncbi:MAG TPA: NUDIX domain-containing protein [Candidatus Fimivivens sp.]|nr:NUDIX domain-containing protein [Candidatus Fimivivens sp.]